MIGMRSKDPATRDRFFDLFESSIGRGCFHRLQYIVAVQDWETTLNDSYWIKQAGDLLLASARLDDPLHLVQVSTPASVANAMPASQVGPVDKYMEPHPPPIQPVNQAARVFMRKHRAFLTKYQSVVVADLLLPLRHLSYYSTGLARHLWCMVFPVFWSR
jgi:hypothetical protein